MKKTYSERSVPELMDMLAKETERLTRFLLNKNSGGEYEKSSEILKDIQQAILEKQMDMPGNPGEQPNRGGHER